MICSLLGVAAAVIKIDSCDDLFIGKNLSILKKLLDISGSKIGNSYSQHWITLTELYSQVVEYSKDAPVKLLNETTACVAIMLSRAVQGVQTSELATAPQVVSSRSLVAEISKDILDHVKISGPGVVELLCRCLATSGSSLMSGSYSLFLAAREACKAIWALIDLHETFSMSGHTYAFPLNSLQTHKHDFRGHNQDSLFESDSSKIVDTVGSEFLKSKAIQVAMYFCLRQGVESSLTATIQIISKISLCGKFVWEVLCGLPNSLPVTTAINGGDDGTVLSGIFSLLSLCASSSNKGTPTGEPTKQKSKLSNPNALVLHSCLALATIAQCLKSAGRVSASCMLTNNPKKQRARLSLLAHLSSSGDKLTSSFQPHCASAMVALASLVSLECESPVNSPISETALALIPPTATLRTYLKLLVSDETTRTSNSGMLSKWHGLGDGCVGLLETRLKWGGPLAVEQACSNVIPQLLICLLAASFQGSNCRKDQVGLSPVGVVWTVSSICHCLPGGSFRDILFRRDSVKIIYDLISGEHLSILKCWSGPGGGSSGIRDVINAVIDLLAFPFVAVQSVPGLPLTTASVNSGFLLNMGSPGGKVGVENRDMVKEIQSNLPHYVKILLESGVPGCVLTCLEYADLKDLAKPIAFLAKMTGYPPLALQLVKDGLLDASRVRSVLGNLSPKEVVLDMLMIVSDLARMSVEFYEAIGRADFLGFLKDFLSHEDPNVRAKACSAIGNMCRHSSYFYSSLAKHEIIGLLIDRCADSDKRTRKYACFAVGNAAYHNDQLYEELRRSIPQLTNLLLSVEEDKTKGNAAGALSNLVRNSTKLCQDIISEGAMQALLKLVCDCSAIALSPSRRDTVNESPLKIALFSLGKMCNHASCRQFLKSSDLFPVLGRLRQSPDSNISNYALLIINKVSEN